MKRSISGKPKEILQETSLAKLGRKSIFSEDYGYCFVNYWLFYFLTNFLKPYMIVTFYNDLKLYFDISSLFELEMCYYWYAIILIILHRIPVWYSG